MKIITVKTDNCSGCRMCEIACSLKKYAEFNPARSRIHVVDFESEACLPVMCFHCGHPYCAEVCTVGAIVRDRSTGIVRVLREKCTGCGLCILACPFGNMVFSSEDRLAANCDICDGKPECVAVCPKDALKLEEVNTERLTLSERVKTIYKVAPVFDFEKMMAIIERKLLVYRSKKGR
jgi:carbon-monoxide dehydrogenase iron sulfur subunit